MTTASGEDFRLVTAAANRDRDAVRALLAEGVDVNAARADGATALLFAAHWDDVELAERLLAAGADVHARPEGPPGQDGADVAVRRLTVTPWIDRSHNSPGPAMR